LCPDRPTRGARATRIDGEVARLMALGKARALIGRPWVWVVVGLLALYYVL
jgi:hypothetical protein